MPPSRQRCIACPPGVEKGQVYRYRMCKPCFEAYRAYSKRADRLLNGAAPPPSPKTVHRVLLEDQ